MGYFRSLRLWWRSGFWRKCYSNSRSTEEEAGGGGYPAAGIGGGGAGGGAGSTAEAGGGFSSGGGEAGSYGGINGGRGTSIGLWCSGGSYFSNGSKGSDGSGIIGILGGKGAGIGGSYAAGSGGKAGGGGNVTIYGDMNRVHAYNGSYITNVNASTQSESWKQSNQSVIYAQLGYNISTISTNHEKFGGNIAARTDTQLIQEISNVAGNYRTINYEPYLIYGKMGIGSGAGYSEIGNGTLEILEQPVEE